jgi:glutamate synthase domain-containing protein 2
LNGLRGRIAVQVDGGGTGRASPSARCRALTSSASATAPLIAAGCIMMRAISTPPGLRGRRTVLRKRFATPAEH